MNAARISELAVRIRAFCRQDLDEVHNLEQEIFSDAWPKSAFEDILNEENWSGLIAESDDGIIGYACILIAAGECHLANIAVDPDNRRKSVANRLLDRILGIARDAECEQVWLEVRASNLEAIAFYTRSGFNEVYKRLAYYHNPDEDAVVMTKSLTGPAAGS